VSDAPFFIDGNKDSVSTSLSETSADDQSSSSSEGSRQANGLEVVNGMASNEISSTAAEAQKVDADFKDQATVKPSSSAIPDSTTPDKIPIQKSKLVGFGARESMLTSKVSNSNSISKDASKSQSIFALDSSQLNGNAPSVKMKGSTSAETQLFPARSFLNSLKGPKSKTSAFNEKVNDESISSGSTNNSNEASTVTPFKGNISNELSSLLRGTATPPAPKQLLAHSFLNSLKFPKQNPTEGTTNNNQPGGIYYNIIREYYLNRNSIPSRTTFSFITQLQTKTRSI
jgi:hypothetical protein